jgi:hypothetical protein
LQKTVNVTTMETMMEWLGRSLENYKSMHRETAIKKDCLAAFLAAKTLTAAKKILFGEKVKKYVGRRDSAK